MTYHPSRAYVLAVALTAEFVVLFGVHCVRQVMASRAEGYAGGELSGAFPSPAVSALYSSQVVIDAGTLEWSGDITGTTSYPIDHVNIVPSSSNYTLLMAGGCGDINLQYPDGGQVVYDGGACKPCIRGCAAIYSDQANRLDSYLPAQITRGLDEVQRCVAGCGVR